MRVDFLAAPAQQAVGRRLGLAGFQLLQNVNTPGGGKPAVRPGDDLPTQADAEDSRAEAADETAVVDPTAQLIQAEQTQATGSRADQRSLNRDHIVDQQQQQAFRNELQSARQQNQPTATQVRPAAPAAPTDATPREATSTNTGETGPDAKQAASTREASSNGESPSNPSTRGEAGSQRPAPLPIPNQLAAATHARAQQPPPHLPTGKPATKPVTPVKTPASQRPVVPQPTAEAAKPAPRPARAALDPESPRPTATRESETQTQRAVTASSQAGSRDGQQDPQSEQRGPNPLNLTKAEASQATRTQEPVEAADRAHNIERIVRVVQAEAASGNSRVVLQLSPPELGSLRMQLNLRRDQLDVRVQAETSVARDLLLGEVDQLRSGLEAAGLELAHLEVQQPQAEPVRAKTVEPIRARTERPQREATPADPESVRDAVAEPRLNVLA